MATCTITTRPGLPSTLIFAIFRVMPCAGIIQHVRSPGVYIYLKGSKLWQIPLMNFNIVFWLRLSIGMSFCGYNFLVECHDPLMKCNTVDKINVLESSYLERFSDGM